MTNPVNVEFPFEACITCTLMSLETEIAYADHRPFMITHYCSNMKICENAIDIVNKSMQMRMMAQQNEETPAPAEEDKKGKPKNKTEE